MSTVVTPIVQLLPRLPDKLPCRNEQGKHLFWSDDATARDLLASRQVRLVRRGGRARVLVATGATITLTLKTSERIRAERVALNGRGTALDKTRYSHHRETETNPSNVWTLKRLPNHTGPIFRAVLDSVSVETVVSQRSERRAA